MQFKAFGKNIYQNATKNNSALFTAYTTIEDSNDYKSDVLVNIR
ncbi:hypothetical protein FNO01nite_23710 [Flavobacterium noncentrifugens]|uniref:Uncharacterized protein n=1 Tax=Flavobacterium noncentrifugens TaxID=1128970 RepID=A0A1G9B418_9FLAO|nr:hypothetical protein FNO01nite_23710 [Flavobacterium noncentrifugens]SDK34281.1 hypothetical protein SAMN04487935_3185 [Flavobacterium noncentrifugens]